MKRTTLAILCLAAIAWASHAFWVQDRSLPEYDPTRGVAIAIMASIVVYAALSIGLEWVTGRERFFYPFLGLVLWGFTFGRLFSRHAADSIFSLTFAILPAFLFLKAVRLVARDAEQEELKQTSSSA